MCDFLIAQGHTEAELLGYSWDKVQLYYVLAQRRTIRNQALEDLRLMRAVQAAEASLMDKQGAHHYKQAERRLIAACSFDFAEKQDAEANRAKVAKTLLAMGAKRAYGRKP